MRRNPSAGRVLRAVAMAALVVLAAACSSSASRAPGSTVPPSTLAGATDRPFHVDVPEEYDGTTPLPLVVVLHGFTSSGDSIEQWLGVGAAASLRHVIEVHPDGSLDANGNRFWNATDACCNETGSTVDDSAWLTSLIHQVQASYAVDPKRIYVIGHSNGGFMANRMACDHADLIAAIISIAGATFSDPARCTPSQPVSVLQIHGTADPVISYTGGRFDGHAYPSAAQTVAQWSALDRCASPPAAVVPGAPPSTVLDLDRTIDGTDTVASGASGCPPGIEVVLWSIVDAGHVPELPKGIGDTLIDWLLAHPKP